MKKKDDFQNQIFAKQQRKLKARKRGNVNIWRGFALFGLVGWSVVIPTLLGIALGVWLDFHVRQGTYSWTVTLLLVGVCVGCIIAWNLSKKEVSKKDDNGDE